MVIKFWTSWTCVPCTQNVGIFPQECCHKSYVIAGGTKALYMYSAIHSCILLVCSDLSLPVIFVNVIQPFIEFFIVNEIHFVQ